MQNNDINVSTIDIYNDFNDYKENSNIIQSISYNLDIINKILEKTKQKERTKKSNFFFSYVKKFSEQGVQGIVGVIILKKILKKDYLDNSLRPNLSQNLLSQIVTKCASGGNMVLSQYFTDIKNIINNKYFITHEAKNIEIQSNIKDTVKINETTFNETGYPLVFKVSVDMNNMIHHEKLIAQQLYSLHSYCPHFINILGEFTIPINSCYIALNAEEYCDESDSDYDSDDSDHCSDSDYDSNEDSDEDDSQSEDDDFDSEDDDFSDDGSENESEESSDESEDPRYKELFEKEMELSKNLFHEAKDALPRTVILYEKINNFPLHRYLKKIKYDNNLLSSQILQLLLALQIAQNKFNFTHYDLHTTNVLQQHCEYNSVFLYNINNKKYIVPTYGYYPKIIDVGSSYCEEVKNHTMLTHANSYDYGFQSQFFDPLNDIHHSMLSLFYYIEDKKSCFDSLSNKIKHIFYRLPVLRKSGWKKLPHDLTDTVLWKIKKDCLPEYENYELFREYKGNFIEILNSLVYIPFDKGLDIDVINTNIQNDSEISEDDQNINESIPERTGKYNSKKIYDIIEKHPKINFKSCFDKTMKELEKIFYNEEVCGEDVIFILKELFFIILKYKKEILTDKDKLSVKYKELEEATEKYNDIAKLKNIKSNKNNQKLLNQSANELNKVKKEVETLEKVYKKIKQELKEKTQSFVEAYVEYDNVNYFNMVNGFIEIGYNIQCIYYLLTKDHQKIIKDVYEKTVPKQPIDMFEYLSRNFTPSFHFDKDTIVYYWDTDDKVHKKYINFYNELDKRHSEINILPFNKKAERLFEILN